MSEDRLQRRARPFSRRSWPLLVPTALLVAALLGAAVGSPDGRSEDAEPSGFPDLDVPDRPLDPETLDGMATQGARAISRFLAEGDVDTMQLAMRQLGFLAKCAVQPLFRRIAEGEQQLVKRQFYQRIREVRREIEPEGEGVALAAVPKGVRLAVEAEDGKVRRARRVIVAVFLYSCGPVPADPSATVPAPS